MILFVLHWTCKKTKNSILSDMKNEISELRNICNKLEVDLKVSKSVTEVMKNHVVVLEHKCWSNKQYSRRECLVISGIPSNTVADELEEMVLKVFEKLDVAVDPKNVEDCQRPKTRNTSKKMINYQKEKMPTKYVRVKKN